jgi:hypothetical protein
MSKFDLETKSGSQTVTVARGRLDYLGRHYGQSYQRFDGQTWYDTGIVITSDTEIDIDMRYTDASGGTTNDFIFGVRWTSNSQTGAFTLHKDTSDNTIFALGQPLSAYGKTVTIGDRHKIIITPTGFNIDGTDNPVTPTWGGYPTTTILLGTRREADGSVSGGRGRFDLFSLARRKSGIVVLDWRPHTQGFYDAVTRQVITPTVGTSNFVQG